jgi:DNA-binding LacI/PurR family transcriptional regulator
VVTVGNRQPGWPSVRIDDGAAMALATRYAIELGHRDIGYAGTVPTSITHLQTPFDRREAFATVMSDHGLVCPPEWTLECDWTAAGAAEHADRMFGSRHFPTCIVAASDEMAFGVLSAARRHGLRVPQDVSVIGIDDHVHAEIFDLTTVRQDVEAQGRRAGQIMLDALRGLSPAATLDEVLDVELVVRGSTAQPPLRRTAATSASHSA